MTKTNRGLVEYVKKAYDEKWGYCLGCYGQILTQGVLNAKMNQGHGVGAYNTRHKNYLYRYIGKRVSDCYGLVKGYIWTNNGVLRYDSKTDRNQEMAYRDAKEKGPISTMPDIPGIILWVKGHAGIYIGNGEFIEIVGVPVGMRKGKINSKRVITYGTKFTHWFKDTYIAYNRQPVTPDPTRRVGTITPGVGAVLREGPSTNTKRLTAIPKGRNVIVTDLSNDWYKVEYNSLNGYIHSSLVRLEADRQKLEEDGHLGKLTISELQRQLGTPVDGIISKPSLMVMELQRRLNNGDLLK